MALVLPIQGQNFIKMNEHGMTSIRAGSHLLTAYKDVNGTQWDVGWGHLLSYKPTSMTITPAQAQAYFDSDIQNALTTLSSTVNATQLAKLSPQQVTACCDLIYNAGPGGWRSSGVPQALSAGNKAKAATLMQQFGCGQDGSRRQADATLMLDKGHINPGTNAYVG